MSLKRALNLASNGRRSVHTSVSGQVCNARYCNTFCKNVIRASYIPPLTPVALLSLGNTVTDRIQIFPSLKRKFWILAFELLSFIKLKGTDAYRIKSLTDLHGYIPSPSMLLARSTLLLAAPVSWPRGQRLVLYHRAAPLEPMK